MVKEIVKDVNILTQPSIVYNYKAMPTMVKDLLDTAKAHSENCVGLAAIQIGYNVRLFVVKNEKNKYIPYINPRIVNRSPETYTAKESCLSLEGEREVKRHSWIVVVYTNVLGKVVKERVSGFKAEVIQHEYDHLDGKLI